MGCECEEDVKNLKKTVYEGNGSKALTVRMAQMETEMNEVKPKLERLEKIGIGILLSCLGALAITVLNLILNRLHI